MEIKDGVFPVHRWSSIVVSGHIDWRLNFFCEDYFAEFRMTPSALPARMTAPISRIIVIDVASLCHRDCYSRYLILEKGVYYL